MMNADRYPSSQDKLWYTITRVSDKVKDQILPYCIDNTVDLTDLSTFEDLMKNVFEDPDWCYDISYDMYNIDYDMSSDYAWMLD